ncbi:uncharacterized protein pdgfbb isoform X2 [Myxocyprinus asiaticus]|uniref:uncharacterized protein pdgfbb isoform X2 n=1 Tax=Myxocyprinus asiaticus TaxID=70543 RepID=UPI002221320D|nr:uncharacterized protein pdgfbb isoform X2 [Myxocyprinus asiaticus]
MSSRIPLLLAVLAAACLRFGSAEADPLPAAVVELVKGGSVSSMQDLQFLLFSESIEVEPDGHHDNDTSNRLPRSLLDAQPAQQAICKVRTEVIEVTRSMLDRSYSNFLLWPPCVEVQRCSGCCNTKSLQCVPVLTHTRYLQVMKIQYVNKRPLYDKAIVSVLDHVECRCQPAPRSPQRRKSSANKQEARDRSGKPRTKDELHRRDELKHNQRLSLEDLLSQSWLPKERLSESGAPDAFQPSGEIKLHFGRDGWALNETQYGGSKGHLHYPGDGWRHHGNMNDTKATPLPNHTEREETEKLNSSLLNITKVSERELSNMPFESQTNANQSKTNQTSEYKTGLMELTNKTFKHHSNITQEISYTNSEEIEHLQRHEPNFAAGTNQNHENKALPTELTRQTDQLTSNATERSNQNQGDVFLSSEENSKRVRSNETSDVGSKEEEKRRGSSPQVEKNAKEEEMEELLLLHKLLDEEKLKHHLKVQQTSTQQDDKLQQLHHKHQHEHITTTTQRIGTTFPPPHRSPPRTPPKPPPHPPKRRRKQRNRISKSAMRALLM